MLANFGTSDVYFRPMLLNFYIFYLFIQESSICASSVDELLDKGTQLLSSGNLNDALSVYRQAVEKDPGNYLAHYRRGSAYLALGNMRLALPDFDKAIELNAGFIPAIKQRAALNLKLGRLAEAEADYNLVSLDADSKNKISEIHDLKLKIDTASSLFSKHQFSNALPLLDDIINVIGFNEDLREMRAECYFKIGELQKGIQEMRYGVHLVNDNRKGLLKLSKLMYEAGLAVRALEEVRECLRLDQDDKDCLKHYKMLKKLAKAITQAEEASEASNYRECIENANQILKLEPHHTEYQMQAKIHLCRCHAKSNSADGVSFCDEVVSRFPDSSDYLCDQAESYINAERFDDAIRVYQSVLGKERNHMRAREGIKRAQKLLKASKRRDYYKILKVPRSASKREILKAYRKLAAQYHPDKYAGAEKKDAEQKFLEISAAKEVLADDKNRAMYDDGVDPLDPEQQQHQGPFHPFGGFSFANMHPFDGGHFEFHFG